jgi:hypothetical protein
MKPPYHYLCPPDANLDDAQGGEALRRTLHQDPRDYDKESSFIFGLPTNARREK